MAYTHLSIFNNHSNLSSYISSRGISISRKGEVVVSEYIKEVKAKKRIKEMFDIAVSNIADSSIKDSMERKCNIAIRKVERTSVINRLYEVLYELDFNDIILHLKIR